VGATPLQKRKSINPSNYPLNSEKIMYIKNDSDLEQLRQKINPILGQLCWQIRLSYGGELCLEIGQKISCHSPLLQDEFKGEWQFGTRCTNWQLIHGNQLLATSDLESEDILLHLKAIEGTKITRLDIYYSDLVLIIGFDNGYQLKVIPDLTDTEYQDIACWELFTPHHRVLEVYPNFTWYDRPSDVPMVELITRFSLINSS
jgi:hypothetical protein